MTVYPETVYPKGTVIEVFSKSHDFLKLFKKKIMEKKIGKLEIS